MNPVRNHPDLEPPELEDIEYFLYYFKPASLWPRVIPSLRSCSVFCSVGQDESEGQLTEKNASILDSYQDGAGAQRKFQCHQTLKFVNPSKDRLISLSLRSGQSM